MRILKSSSGGFGFLIFDEYRVFRTHGFESMIGLGSGLGLSTTTKHLITTKFFGFSIFQLFSNLYAVFIISNITTLNLSTFSNVFDVRFPLWIGYAQFIIVHFNILFIIFTFLECIVLKYWMKFVCKTILPIDTQFVVTTLTITNLIIGSFLAFVRLQSGGGAVSSSEVISYMDFCTSWCRKYPYELK